MKQRKQYVGKPPVYKSLIDSEMRISALERAGLNVTTKVIRVNAPPRKIPPMKPQPQPDPIAPIPVPDRLPAFWSVNSYNLGFASPVQEKTHIFVYINSVTQEDTTNAFGGGTLQNYDPAEILTTNMSVNLLYDETLTWGESQHNNPETYFSGQHRIQIYECIAIADDATVAYDLSTIEHLYTSSALSITWTKSRAIDADAHLGDFSVVVQDSDETGTIGPVASSSMSISIPALPDDMTLTCGPFAGRDGGAGSFTDVSAIPDLAQWDSNAGFGYEFLSTDDVQSSSISADFEVNDPGGADGHHETYDSAFVVGIVLRHE